MRYFVLLFFISIWIFFGETFIENSYNSTSKHKANIYKKKVIDERYYIAPKYKLATCVVHKSFSAMMTSILCYLDMEKIFMRTHKHLADFTFKYKTCVKKKDNGLNTFNELIQVHGKGKKSHFLKTWKVIMIVRNPIERFISGFVHICYKHIGKHTDQFCLGCRGNFKCFVNRMYNIIKSGYNSMLQAYHPTKSHFFPQTMQCNYRFNKHKFIILKFDPKNLDPFYESLEEILIQQNVSREKVNFIDKEIRNYRIPHSTTGKSKTKEFIEKLYKEKKVLHKLIKIFYADFIEFGYKIPQI